MTERKISKEHKEELEAELKELVEVNRPRIIKDMQKARSYGDLSENAEYSKAKDNQSINESRIMEIESLLKMSIVVDNPKKNNIVMIGSSVLVKSSAAGKVTYDIGRSGKGIEISEASPIATALIGSEKGDVVSAKIPSGEIELKIIDIK